MATHIVTDPDLIDNLPPTLQQAITAAQALQPQVNGRYASAVHLVATGGARLNTDGSVDVISRSGGVPHRLNGASCDCKDAQYNAPEIAGRRACAHQIAAWILRKAARLSSTSSLTNLPTSSPASEPAELESVQPPTSSVQPPTSNFHFTQAHLLTAASRLAGDAAYEINTTHIGGHGDVNILQALDNPLAHPTYLVCGNWHDDELFVAHWGRRWGQVDDLAMGELAAALVTPAPPSQAVEIGPLMPALAYYLETSANGVKVMVTHGETNPRPVKQFSGPQRIEQAREFAATRAEAQLRGLQQATPGARVDLRNDLLPETWRQRMGGSQIGKAWVVYAERIAQRAAA